MPFVVKVILVLLAVILLEFYFVKRIVGSLNNLFPNISQRKIKLVKWFILTVINIYPVFTIFSGLYSLLKGGGGFFLPENTFLDYFVIYPFWIGTLIIVQSTLIFIFIEAGNLFFIPFTKEKKETRKRIVSVLFLFIFAASIVYIPIRITYDYNTVEINKFTYKKKDLPDVLNGFKVTLISDVQADRYTDEKRLQKFIDKANSTKPDLILMGGDMITGSPNYIRASAEMVGKLKAKFGTYTCVGDHDNWAYRGDNHRSIKEITGALAEVGIPMINNNNLLLGIDSANINVTFVTNTYVETINQKLLDSLTGNNNNADFRIFVTHQPRNFLIEKAVEKNFDLFLAGHTHGGQITFLFPFYNLSPTMVETPYMRGRFEFGSLSLIVTRGLGMSLAPVRYNSTPEVALITLNKL